MPYATSVPNKAVTREALLQKRIFQALFIVNNTKISFRATDVAACRS